MSLLISTLQIFAFSIGKPTVPLFHFANKTWVHSPKLRTVYVEPGFKPTSVAVSSNECKIKFSKVFRLGTMTVRKRFFGIPPKMVICPYFSKYNPVIVIPCRFMKTWRVLRRITVTSMYRSTSQNYRLKKWKLWRSSGLLWKLSRGFSSMPTYWHHTWTCRVTHKKEELILVNWSPQRTSVNLKWLPRPD